MPILIYNTLTRKKEEFKPIKPGHVNMYVCGITPYDEVHLGHARAYVTFDIIHRHLENSGYKVNYIQNFTDIDDKIINRSKEKNIPPLDLANKHIAGYFKHMHALNIKDAESYPRVTETIPQIIDFVKLLIDKGFAYEIDGDVYFSARKFSGYGKLSRRNPDDLLSGARVCVDERKKDPLDFALWKKSKPDEPKEVQYDSPWGKGRPGWHIECSVMSTNSAGATLDIHGGGQDLIFPHHENEIAQSEAATGKPFAKYWIHNGFVTINREKMSKSLGNFFTLREIFEKYSPRIVRYFLLTQHYRSPLDFSDDKLKQAENALKGIDEAFFKINDRLSAAPAPDKVRVLYKDKTAKFTSALDDDFNTENALAVVHEIKNEVLTDIYNKSQEELSAALYTLRNLLDDYLGISVQHLTASVSDEIKQIAKRREEERKNKNWKESDRLRQEADSRGFKLIDNPDGTTTIIPK